MNLEKLFYVVTSTILITIFLLFTFILSPDAYKSNLKNKEKTIYYVDHISAAHQKLIDIFNDKYKGQIKVKTINLTFDKFSTNERKDLLARYLRSKSNRIDLFSVDIIWVPRFRKWTVPLNKFIDSNLINKLLPHTLETCIFNDTLYAVPLYTDVALMFYRDDQIRNLPDYESIKNDLRNGITWEKFIELKNKLEKHSRTKKPFYIFQADKYEGLMCSFIEIINNFNQSLITNSGQVKIKTEEVEKSIKFFIDLVNKYKISPKEICNFRENESYQYFSNNEAFAVRGWPSFFSKENKYIKPELLKNIVKAPTPHFSKTKPASVFGGWNLMVSKYSDKIPEVVKFIEFLISPEAQKILYEEGGYLPINLSLYNSNEFISKHPELLFYQKLFKQGIHRPISENYTTISDVISIELSKAIEFNLSPKEVIEAISHNLNENILNIK